jgi:hypothetical protein
MPSQVRKAAAYKMSLSLLSRSDEFVNYIDEIYFEGYALRMSVENPSRLTYEYFEFLKNL